MTDKNIPQKEVQITNLANPLKRKPRGLKNHLLYNDKKVRVDSLIEERSLNDDEIAIEKRELSERTTLHEHRHLGMWYLAKQINQEEQCLTEMKSSHQKGFD